MTRAASVAKQALSHGLKAKYCILHITCIVQCLYFAVELLSPLHLAQNRLELLWQEMALINLLTILVLLFLQMHVVLALASGIGMAHFHYQFKKSIIIC